LHLTPLAVLGALQLIIANVMLGGITIAAVNRLVWGLPMRRTRIGLPSWLRLRTGRESSNPRLGAWCTCDDLPQAQPCGSNPPLFEWSSGVRGMDRCSSATQQEHGGVVGEWAAGMCDDVTAQGFEGGAGIGCPQQ
jgi:hypothetical protein